MDNLKKIYILLLTVLIVVVLVIGQDIIVPFILAILFWFIIRIIRGLLSKLILINRLPGWVLTSLATILFITVAGLFVSLITKNIQTLSEALPLYESNINFFVDSINSRYNVDLVQMITEYVADFDFAKILSGVFSALTSIFGDVFIVLIFLLFILLEESSFSKKLMAMYPKQEKYESVKSMIDKIGKSVSDYLGVKTLTSLLTGFLSFFALLIIGVDAPLFWAFLIFILNYIPTVGSLIATFFPTAFALLQFGDLSHGVLVLSIVGAIQIIVGNILEPRLMGSSLNISPLVVILTLIIWNAIWGVVGMLLSVMITVILIIVLAEFEGGRPIAILLSKKTSPPVGE